MSNRIKTYFHKAAFFRFKVAAENAHMPRILFDFNLKIQFFIGNVITSPGKSEFINPQLKSICSLHTSQAINHLPNVDEYLTQVFRFLAICYCVSIYCRFSPPPCSSWDGIFLWYLLGHIS